MSHHKAGRLPRNILLSTSFFSDEQLDETIRVWQPRSPHRNLTREDAREIISNVYGFFQVLDEWDREVRKQEGR